MAPVAQRFRRLALALLGVCTLLLASQRGEFWPFSIFPMFSRGGRSWTRTLVRDVSASPDGAWNRPGLIGEPFALDAAAIAQNDLAKIVLSFGEQVDADEAALLARLFAPARSTRKLVLYRATGALDARGGVAIETTPLVLLDASGAHALGTARP